MPTRVHHAANADDLSCTEACDLGAGTHHTADDLVAWHNRVYGAGPLAACRVEIGVTDTAEEDVDLDIAGAGLAPGEVE